MELHLRYALEFSTRRAHVAHADLFLTHQTNGPRIGDPLAHLLRALVAHVARGAVAGGEPPERALLFVAALGDRIALEQRLLGLGHTLAEEVVQVLEVGARVPRLARGLVVGDRLVQVDLLDVLDLEQVDERAHELDQGRLARRELVHAHVFHEEKVDTECVVFLERAAELGVERGRFR